MRGLFFLADISLDAGRLDSAEIAITSNARGLIAGVIVGKKTGVAPGARIISIRLGDNTKYESDALSDGLFFVRSLKPDIVNISLGHSNYNAVEAEAYKGLMEKGILIVAAAGNNGSGARFPAAYGSVISAVGVDQQAKHYEKSNIWPTAKIAAPAKDIITTSPSKPGNVPQYCRTHGTSFAAAHISGILALGASYLKRKHQYDPLLLMRSLYETAIDVSQEEPYRTEAMKLIKEYQERIDPEGIFLKCNAQVIQAMYGRGLARVIRMLEYLHSKT